MWLPSEDGSRVRIPVRGIPFDVSYTLKPVPAISKGEKW
jgi:hypothetical protein